MRLWWVRVLAVALSTPSTLAGAAHDQTSVAKVRTIRSTKTTTTTTTATTLFLTRTRTITIQPTASAAPDGTMDGGGEYLLQGCYGEDGLDNIGTILGTNYITRNATAAAGRMSLSMCLESCGSSATSDRQQPYTYFGVSDGK